MRLHDILMYWRINRGAGHSEAQLQGLSFEGTFIYVVTNRDQAQEVIRRCRILKKPQPRILTISDNETKLHGMRLPLVVDHAAMDLLVEREIRHLEEMSIKGRREKNTPRG